MLRGSLLNWHNSQGLRKCPCVTPQRLRVPYCIRILLISHAEDDDYTQCISLVEAIIRI